jgi:hypothetical protein
VLFALGGTSNTNVWAVGEGGTILRFDGTKWSNPESGTTVTLRSVFASQEDDAWAVGDGGVAVHFDGSAWAPDTKANLTVNLLGVHGATKNDVWAVDEDRRRCHDDATHGRGRWQRFSVGRWRQRRGLAPGAELYVFRRR